MPIPHELPPSDNDTIGLLPQRPALFTAVNQSISGNKQQKETGAVNGPSTSALFHDFIGLEKYPKLCQSFP